MGFKESGFLEKMQLFESWLASVEAVPIDQAFRRRLALGLVISGFDVPAHLLGLVQQEYGQIAESPTTCALLNRAVMKVENEASS